MHEEFTAVSQLKSNDGLLTTSDTQAADILCQSFHKMFTSKSGTFLSETESSDIADDVVISFNPETVLKNLLSLNIDKSPGCDGLHPAILKQCVDAVAEPLTLVFQKSYDTGTLLDNVHHCSNPGNYRPVSLISTPGSNS